MIVLFTDFGFHGPYLGQMKAVIWQKAPNVPIIDLFADAPVHNPKASAYLLASYAESFPAGTVFLAVVDPGVGSGARRPAIVHADGRWFVGPDNGLFNVIAARASECEAWHINWQPQSLSASFHGRDIFAPLATQLVVRGGVDVGILESTEIGRWADELFEIIYIDHFGNLLTGVRACTLAADVSLRIGSIGLPRVRTFSDVPAGSPLCYENANGLLEIAVNQGRAADYFGASIGDAVSPLNGA